MKTFWFLVVLSVMLMLSACLNMEQNDGTELLNEEQNNEQGSEKNESDKEDNLEEKETDQVAKDTDTEKIDDPEKVADKIILALAEKNMEMLATFIHPSVGVRFSPHGFIRAEDDLVFTDVEVIELMDDDTVYQWGVFDGKGNPIEVSFAEYFERFIYDEDFLNAEEKSVDERLGQGNMLDNTADVYPEATVIEYYFSGFDPQYDGMDWRSLRIVLEKEAGQWYLIGIVHDEWTI